MHSSFCLLGQFVLVAISVFVSRFVLFCCFPFPEGVQREGGWLVLLGGSAGAVGPGSLDNKLAVEWF